MLNNLLAIFQAESCASHSMVLFGSLTIFLNVIHKMTIQNVRVQKLCVVRNYLRENKPFTPVSTVRINLGWSGAKTLNEKKSIL